MWPRTLAGVSYPRAALIAVAAAYFSTQVAMSPVSPLLPTLADHFAVDVSTVTWVLTSYLLTMAGLVLVGGRLGDMFGHRQVFAWGTGVFTAGSLLSSLAPSLTALVAFRAIQGIGSAVVLGNSLAILADAFPEGRRGRAVGVAVMGSALGSLFGLILVSVSVQYLDWRLLFHLMTLGGVSTMVLAMRLLRFPGTHARQEGQTFDLVGAILLFGALVALVITPYHLHSGEPSYRAGLPYHVATFGTFLVLGGLFVLVERRHPNPLVKLGHLRHIPFSFSLASNVVLHWNMAVTMMLPFLIQKGLGLGPWYTTLALVTGLGVSLTFSPLVGWIYDRTRSRAMRPVAMSIMALGLALMFLLGRGLSYWGFYALVVFRGMGSSVFLTPNNTAILNSLPAEWRGFATGSLETTRQMGHTFGVTVASLVFALTVPVVGAMPQDFIDGFRNTALAITTITIAGAILVAFAGKTPPRRR